MEKGKNGISQIPIRRVHIRWIDWRNLFDSIIRNVWCMKRRHTVHHFLDISWIKAKQMRLERGCESKHNWCKCETSLKGKCKTSFGEGVPVRMEVNIIRDKRGIVVSIHEILSLSDSIKCSNVAISLFLAFISSFITIPDFGSQPWAPCFMPMVPPV